MTVRVTVLVAVMALFLPVSVASAAAAGGVDPADEVRFVELINAERAEHGLAPLTVHLQLTRLSRDHSGVMAADSDAGGTCGDGSTLRHRSPIDAGITESWRSLRENVGCGSGGLGTPENLHDGFMGSAGHRDNILGADVEFIGVGVIRDGAGGSWVTQIFMGGGLAPVLTATGEGLAASQTTFPSGTRPDFVVVSRGDLFADSLGGAALAGADAPILFTDGPTATEPAPVLRPETRVEIDRLLGGSGRVYLLGGDAAVSPRVAQELAAAGYDVRRLAGATRIETAIAIAEETVRLRGAPDRIAVAYAYNWPDAVTGGAAAGRHGAPLVLVATDEVPAATAAFLDGYPAAERLVLGGKAVISEGVRAAVSGTRLSGPTRHDTALAIADGFFGAPSGKVVVIDGWNADGWGRALAWSTYAAKHGGPQVLVNDDVPPTVDAWLRDVDNATAVFGSGVTAAARSQVTAALSS